MAARRRRASDAGQTLCSTDSHRLFRSLHLSTWLSLETLTLGAGNPGIPAFREPLKHSLALTQTPPPTPRPLCPFLSSNLSPFTMGLEQSGSTAPLHSCGSESQRGCCYFRYPSSTREHDHHIISSTVRAWCTHGRAKNAVLSKSGKLIKYCQLSDADNQPCLVTPAWPCSFVSHYGLIHAAGRWHRKPSKKKKNLFSLKDCSRVDRTKSHRNDTFMYLHLGYSYPRCYCYDYCPNWNEMYWV